MMETSIEMIYRSATRQTATMVTGDEALSMRIRRQRR